MFNVGSGELLVILLVALLVLGPGKLPDAARQIGNVLTQVRQMSSGFQRELKSAMDETLDPPKPAEHPTDTHEVASEPATPDGGTDGGEPTDHEATMADDDPTDA